MTEMWDEQLMWSKYHIAVSKRLVENFSNYEEKRFLIAIINELATTATHVINAFLIYTKIKYNVYLSNKANERLETLKKQIKKNTLTEQDYNTLIQIIELKRTQKKSPIQYQKNEKILLLKNEKYIFVSIDTLKNLTEKLEKIIKNFPN